MDGARRSLGFTLKIGLCVNPTHPSWMEEYNIVFEIVCCIIYVGLVGLVLQFDCVDQIIDDTFGPTQYRSVARVGTEDTQPALHY